MHAAPEVRESLLHIGERTLGDKGSKRVIGCSLFKVFDIDRQLESPLFRRCTCVEIVRRITHTYRSELHVELGITRFA